MLFVCKSNQYEDVLEMAGNKMTNQEIADALELLTLSDAFAGNKMACNLFKMVSERLREEKLKKALLLAKEMMIANDLSLPKTFEVIDEALNT